MFFEKEWSFVFFIERGGSCFCEQEGWLVFWQKRVVVFVKERGWWFCKRRVVCVF